MCVNAQTNGLPGDTFMPKSKSLACRENSGSLLNVAERSDYISIQSPS